MPSENNRRIAKNTMMLYVRLFFTMLVSLYTSRIILKALGVQDFGIYNVVGGIVAMFGFLNGTLSSGTQRFLSFQLGRNNQEELRKIFSASLVIHFLLALLVLILAETGGLWFLNVKLNIPADRLSAARWVYQFSVLAGVISILQAPYNAIIFSHEKMSIYAYMSIVEVVLKLLIVYLLQMLDYDKLILYSILTFLVNALIMLIYRGYCKRKYVECIFHLCKDKPLYMAMLSFSGWNIFGSMGATFTNQGINILLNLFYGPVVNSARAIAYQVSNALMSFVTNFQTAINPQIIKLYAEDKRDDLYELIFQNAKYAYLLTLFISLPVFLELDTALNWWLKTVPENTAIFCRIILIQCLLYSFMRPFIMAIHATGKMKAVNLTAGTALIMVLPISYMLLKFGFPSFAPFILYIVSTIVEFSFELYYLRKLISLSIKDLFAKSLLPIFNVTIVSVILPGLFRHFMKQGILRFFVVLSLSCVSVMIFSYWFAIDAASKESFKAMFDRKKLLRRK